MKKCPFCAEEIQDEAILCRYCGKELTPTKPKNWNYLILVFHFRNLEESGWIIAEGTPPASAAQHFWNEMHQTVAEVDRGFQDSGWEVIEPRDASCLKLEIVRNSKGYDPVMSTVAAVFTMGRSLVSQAVGYEKWWVSSFILKYRKPAEETKEEIMNFWMKKGNNKDWERIEKDPLTKELYIWQRPKDFNSEDPDDDRWDKIPVKTPILYGRPVSQSKLISIKFKKENLLTILQFLKDVPNIRTDQLDKNVSQYILNKIDGFLRTGDLPQYVITLTIKEWKDLSTIIIIVTPLINQNNQDWINWANHITSHINSAIPKS